MLNSSARRANKCQTYARPSPLGRSASGPTEAWWKAVSGPSHKRVSRIKQKVGELLDRRNVAPWEEVCQKLNRQLQGWRQYFSCGSKSQACRAVDEYVYDRLEQRIFGGLIAARVH